MQIIKRHRLSFCSPFADLSICDHFSVHIWQHVCSCGAFCSNFAPFLGLRVCPVCFVGLRRAHAGPPCMTPLTFCLLVSYDTRRVWRDAKICGAERRETKQACTNKQYRGRTDYASQSVSILQYISLSLEREKKRWEEREDGCVHTAVAYRCQSSFRVLFMFMLTHCLFINSFFFTEYGTFKSSRLKNIFNIYKIKYTLKIIINKILSW